MATSAELTALYNQYGGMRNTAFEGAGNVSKVFDVINSGGTVKEDPDTVVPPGVPVIMSGDSLLMAPNGLDGPYIPVPPGIGVYNNGEGGMGTTDQVTIPSTSAKLYDSNGKFIAGALKTSAPGVYTFQTANNDGGLQVFFGANPKTGTTLPISNPNQISFTESKGLGGLGGILGSFTQALGPIAQIALAVATQGAGTALATELGISQTAGNALAGAAIQAVQGKDLGQIAQGAALNAIAGELKSAGLTNTEALNKATESLQDVYGGNLPVEDISAALQQPTVPTPVETPTIPEAVTVGAPIPTPDIVPAELPPLEPSIVQPDYFSADAGPLEDTTKTFDTITPEPSPSAAPETPAPVDTAFVKDMSEGIVPEVNLEGGDLGVTEAEAQNQYYKDIGLDPGTVVDTPITDLTIEDTTMPIEEAPETPDNKIPNLTPSQLFNLLKLGVGLFGGGGLLAKAANNLTGGPSIEDKTMPVVQAPTPFTGTYSGMNPNDAAYYQQVQQNYNRLFPTAPADIATPLQSWYQTKYVPDTTISNKLFGI